MSGKSMEYNGRQERLIDENEYRNHKARNQFYTGLVLKNDGTLIMVNRDLRGIGTTYPGFYKGTTVIVAQPEENPIYDPVLIAEAKRQLEPKWYPAGGQLNWFYGLGALALENTPGTFRWRSGLASGNYFSPKYYASGWRGGSRARITTRFVSGLGRTLGLVSIGASIMLDGFGVRAYLRDKESPNAVSPSKFSLNMGLLGYGYFIPGGSFISAGYFAIDSFYPGGWQGALDNNADLQRRNEKVIPGFKLYQKY